MNDPTRDPVNSEESAEKRPLGADQGAPETDEHDVQTGDGPVAHVDKPTAAGDDAPQPNLPAGGSVVDEEERRQPLSILVDVIVAPVGAFRYLSRERHVVLAFLIAFAVMLTFSAWTPDLGAVDESLTISPWESLLSAVAGTAIGLVFVAGVYHLTARLLGGKNRFVFIFQAVGFAALPNLLVAPLYVAHRIVGIPLLVQFADLATNIWTSVLTVIALRELYRFSTARAIAAFLIPLVVGFLVLAPLSLFLFGLLFGL